MPNEPSDSEIFTIKEVSEYLKVTERTIYRLSAAKKIPGFKDRERGAFLKQRSINGYAGSPKMGCRKMRLPTLGEGIDDCTRRSK